MEISVLQEFVVLVETCSFQETSAIMNVSQSALTKHIQKMEEELNLALFDRSTRSVALNEYSRALYPYAKQIVQLHTEANALLNDMNDSIRKSVSVAYKPIMGQYGLIELITAFSEKYPSHTIQPLETAQPLELLKSRKCSFAFVGEEYAEHDFNRIIYKTDSLVIVVPSDHPLAQSPFLTMEQIQNEDFVLHSSSNGSPHYETQKFLELCKAKKFNPKVSATSDFTATMLRLVSSHKGIGVMSRLRVPDDIPNITAIELYPQVYSNIYLLYQRKLSSDCAKDFLHYMIEITQ